MCCMEFNMGRSNRGTKARKSCKLLISVALLMLFGSMDVVKAEEGEETEPSFYAFEKGGLQLYESSDGNSKITLGGEVLFRYAYWNWFEAPSDKNEYTFGFQRTRLKLRCTTGYLDLFIEPQYVHMVNVPDDAVSPPPRGPLGMGGLYYLHNDDTEPYDVGFHQAYIELTSPFGYGFSFKGGRFEYSDGLEVLQPSDGQKFNALKKMRIGDRLISPFGWSAFGRSFDGGLAEYDNRHVNVTAGFFYPTQGGWEEDIDDTIDEIPISTFTVTSKRGTVFPGAELAAFYYNYRDDRDWTQRVDDTGSPAVEDCDIDIHMLGGHMEGLYGLGPGELDVLLWGGGQFGDWYELDQQAFAVSAELGYQLPNLFAKPWLRAGYYVGSGDSNPGDNDHETFFQMAPGTRKYNLLPYCDLMNVEDMFVQLITRPTKKTTIRLDYHYLRVNEEKDKWYMGSGPTQDERHRKIFGYIGRPTNDDDDLAQELDLIVEHKINPHSRIALSYSHIFGGDVIEGVYGEDEEADYASVELTLQF